MKVQGYEISQTVVDKAMTWFPTDRSFTAGELAGALERLGVPSNRGTRWTASRAADRLLQKWRKAGTHAYSGGKWKRRSTSL